MKKINNLKNIYPNLDYTSGIDAQNKAISVKDKLAKISAFSLSAIGALVPMSDLQATVINNAGFTSPISIIGNTGTAIDIDADGNFDFVLGNSTSFNAHGAIAIGSGIGIHNSATRLASGAIISTTNSVGSTYNMYDSSFGGAWGGTTSGFLGVRFNSTPAGGPVFGWVSICATPTSMTITGWAYEDSGGAITTPAIPACPQDASVPTLSEWGIITLFLSILATGAAFIARGRAALAGIGQNITVNNRRFPFDKALFGKTLLGTLGVMTALFATAMAAFGYELTAADIPGILITSPLIAYVVHLMVGTKSQKS